MDGEKRREIAVEVYTGTHQIVGFLSTEQGRLSDTLNYELPHILVLTDVSSKPLEQPDQPPVRGTLMHIDTMTIAFTVPRGPELSLEERQQTRDFEYQEKQLHRVVVKVPPFEFEGYLHLPKGNDVERSLWSLTPAFIPLTDARVTLSGRPDLTWHKELVILNRRKAQIMLPRQQP